jgi:flagellar biosynthesis protein FlhA
MTSRKSAVYAFAGLLLTVVAILIVPLPPWLLDLLLGVNIFGSALVLLLSVTVEDPLEFSAFAPALLIATLFRLSLDVSATRLILGSGATPGAVGAIIPAFGAFVVHGNLVVGLIVFSILVTIQFVVIASGSQRVAEVAARFTLDAMPGKQMAIDADVHAGALDGEGARRKREAVQREADFYGAMDGAGKFVKGDAIAALIIVGLELDRRRRRRHRLPWPVTPRRAQYLRAPFDRERVGHDAARVLDLDGDGHDGHARRVGWSAGRRPRGSAVLASRRPA